MKFNPTWPQVALVMVLLAAVILAHVFAPLAVSAVVSIVSTIVGALFVNMGPPKEPSAPELTVLPGGKEDKS